MVDRSRTWGVRHYAALMLTVALVVAGQAGCSKPPAGPTVVNITNVNTNTINVGQTGTDPADGNKAPGSVLKDIDSLTVNAFVGGEKCPSGIAPANDNKKVRLGCDLAVTLNPRRKDGSVIQDDHAPAPDYFILATGQDAVTFSPGSNPYNGDVHTKAAGKFGFLASVAGVPTKELQEFEVVK